MRPACGSWCRISMTGAGPLREVQGDVHDQNDVCKARPVVRCVGAIAAGCGKSDSSADKGNASGGAATSSESGDSMLFDPEQGKFSVRAPGTMDGHAGGAGGKVYTLKTPTLTYTVGYSETNLPADAAPRRINTFLDAAVSELQFESDSRTVGDPKSMEISGARARRSNWR